MIEIRAIGIHGPALPGQPVPHPLAVRRHPAPADRAERRLVADAEPLPACDRNVEQFGDVTIGLVLVDDRDHQPDMVESSIEPAERQLAGDVADSLGEQDPAQIRGIADQLPELAAPGRVDGAVEHIRQRGAEHPRPMAMLRSKGLRLPVPDPRLGPVRGRGPAPRSVRPPVGNAGEAAIAGLGIAVVATRADLLAALPGVEGVVAPLDRGILTHRCAPSR